MTTPPPATLTLLRTIIRLSCTSNHGVPQVNVNTMTTDAIRDELARREGWTTTEHGWMNDEETVNDHPIPATLDEAAKLPAPWKLSNLILWADNRIVAEAIWPQCENRPIEAIGDTELEARFRLRLACTITDEGSKT